MPWNGVFWYTAATSWNFLVSLWRSWSKLSCFEGEDYFNEGNNELEPLCSCILIIQVCSTRLVDVWWLHWSQRMLRQGVLVLFLLSCKLTKDVTNHTKQWIVLFCVPYIRPHWESDWLMQYFNKTFFKSCSFVNKTTPKCFYQKPSNRSQQNFLRAAWSL